MEHDPVYSVIGGMIGYRAKALPWKRQTRLRVMEFLFAENPYTIRTSLDISASRIKKWLDIFHPEWVAGVQEAPTPEDVAARLRALCEHFSEMMVNSLGNPKDYDDQPALEQAVVKLYED
jgi:hypothetical protein